ncbi:MULTISPECIES: phage regulatory CII family protein [unclassified Massilia]|uniref:phage regulatory CII family protein n=1 Tax=unclassified Massilia TaxID=2609279 RepID=UPI001782EBA8|nr:MULTISPECIES: phage regulatory CII family protein [unclassified Massilia]MBD8528382.1 hypothetical protein [Massilia sp. CFBP 13647]MBD8671996.1 hypothetical protein [Massilia sp. CFBP 13721]
MTLSGKPKLPANVQAAIEDTVGLKGEDKKWAFLAGRLGLTEGVLRNKVAAEKEDKRHHLTLAEALHMAHATDDHVLIRAICQEFGGEFLHYPRADGASDHELLAQYTSMMRELGQFSNDIHLSLADGRIDPNELANLRKDFLRLSGALSEIMDRLQAKASRDATESARPAGA